MDRCKLVLTFAALALLISWDTQPARAAGAGAFPIAAGSSLRRGAERLDQPVLHRHRVQSFYCYPKNYWWFYRPYTTAYDNHARCMPYFHYLEPGAKSGRVIK